jgi:hypothetical protein
LGAEVEEGCTLEAVPLGLEGGWPSGPGRVRVRSMADISLEPAQRCEYAAELRFKFASRDERGTLCGDALSEEYSAIFEQLPEPWSVTPIG